jgi:hypothetical protein
LRRSPSVKGRAGHRHDHVASRPALDLGKEEVGGSYEDVHADAAALSPQRPDRVQGGLERRLAVHHEIPGGRGARVEDGRYQDGEDGEEGLRPTRTALPAPDELSSMHVHQLRPICVSQRGS